MDVRNSLVATLVGLCGLGWESERRNESNIMMMSKKKKENETKKRSEDPSQKLPVETGKFLIPIKYRNCIFYSVS